jgi:hypothetical protein
MEHQLSSVLGLKLRQTIYFIDSPAFQLQILVISTSAITILTVQPIHPTDSVSLNNQD